MAGQKDLAGLVQAIAEISRRSVVRPSGRLSAILTDFELHYTTPIP